jgi:hypothetical protein
LRAVFWNTAHEFVSLFGIGCAFSAVKINGQRHVTGIRQFGRLLFYPVIQAPPLMNHDQCGKRSRSFRRIQHRLHSFVAGFVGDLPTFFGEAGDRKKRHCG